METIKGKCKCGVKITKIVNNPNSSSVDGVSYKYTNDINNKFDIFRCRNCKKVISDRWSKL